MGHRCSRRVTGFGRVCLKLYWCGGVGSRLIGMVVGIMQRQMYIVVKRVAQIAFTMGLLMSCSSTHVLGTTIDSFNAAKKHVYAVHQMQSTTFYCACAYAGKSILPRRCSYTPRGASVRARRVEVDHIVPAAHFGRAFTAWTRGLSSVSTVRASPLKGGIVREKHPNCSAEWSLTSTICRRRSVN